MTNDSIENHVKTRFSRLNSLFYSPKKEKTHVSPVKRTVFHHPFHVLQAGVAHGRPTLRVMFHDVAETILIEKPGDALASKERLYL